MYCDGGGGGGGGGVGSTFKSATQICDDMAMWYYRPSLNCHGTTRRLNPTGLYDRGYQGMKQSCVVAIQLRGDIPHRTTLSVRLYHGCIFHHQNHA